MDSPESSQFKENSDLTSMLRIMDVASELRRQREFAEEQLDLSSQKAKIREKILATAEITGEELSEGEVNAAIESFYSGLYRFKSPKRNISYYLARLYTKRATILLWVVAPLLALFSISTINSSYQNYQAEQKIANRLLEEKSLKEKATKLQEAIQQVAKGAEASKRSSELLNEFESGRIINDQAQMAKSIADLEQLLSTLNLEYEVTIVSQAGVKSGVDRFYTDKTGQRISGYYLIVEAITQDGKKLSVAIQNAESGETKIVKRWGEQVSSAVFEQIKRDKLEDGILNQRLFSRKLRGEMEPQILMKDTNGKPLSKGSAITQW